jgi:hypothetical protein
LRLTLVLGLALGLALPGTPAQALTEPGEADMRRAYVAYLQQFLTTQGQVLDPACNIARNGCSVALLDTRRDYRLKEFRKQACHPEQPAGFACSFQANVTCTYSSKGKPNPLVADLYCGPLLNKTSSYTAVFEYARGSWVLSRFTQG